jgi:hypothetical protein
MANFMNEIVLICHGCGLLHKMVVDVDMHDRQCPLRCRDCNGVTFEAWVVDYEELGVDAKRLAKLKGKMLK